MNSTEGSAGSGLALLVTGATVVSAVSSALADLRVVAVTALALAGVLLVVLLLRAAPRARHPVPSGRRGGHRPPELARRAGAEDMRTAWLHRHLGLLPPQQRAADTAFVAARLAEVPRADWDAARLRLHGRALWSVRDAAARTPLHQQVEARLDRVAAMVADLTDDEFDTHEGQRDDRYLLHADPAVRAAYLAGGSEAVEAIMGTISAARAQARADAAAQAAADSLAQERNAALRALRELHRPTGARDAHAAWEEQARRIGR